MHQWICYNETLRKPFNLLFLVINWLKSICWMERNYDGCPKFLDEYFTVYITSHIIFNLILDDRGWLVQGFHLYVKIKYEPVTISRCSCLEINCYPEEDGWAYTYINKQNSSAYSCGGSNSRPPACFYLKS